MWKSSSPLAQYKPQLRLPVSLGIYSVLLYLEMVIDEFTEGVVVHICRERVFDDRLNLRWGNLGHLILKGRWKKKTQSQQ